MAKLENTCEEKTTDHESTSEEEHEESPLDKLISTEWDIINDLKKILKKPDLSVTDRVKASNSVAYHASVLNKILDQKGEEPNVHAVTLRDLARNYQQQKCFRRNQSVWQRRLLQKK